MALVLLREYTYIYICTCACRGDAARQDRIDYYEDKSRATCILLRERGRQKKEIKELKGGNPTDTHVTNTGSHNVPSYKFVSDKAIITGERGRGGGGQPVSKCPYSCPNAHMHI